MAAWARVKRKNLHDFERTDHHLAHCLDCHSTNSEGRNPSPSLRHQFVDPALTGATGKLGTPFQEGGDRDAVRGGADESDEFVDG